MDQTGRKLRSCLIILTLMLTMMYVMTQTALADDTAVTYSSGTVKVSDLKEGDIISRGAGITRDSGSDNDVIILQANGYCEYYGDNELYDEADCSRNKSLAFKDYGNNPGWSYNNNIAWFTWKSSKDKIGYYDFGYYGPAAGGTEASSWKVAGISGDLTNGFTLILTGCIINRGEIISGRNENLIFGEIGDYTYSFTPDVSGKYKIHSDIGGGFGGNEAFGILKKGSELVIEDCTDWTDDFGFECDLQSGTTYTLYTINADKWGGNPFTAAVVVEKDNSTLRKIANPNRSNGQLQIRTDPEDQAYPGDTVTVKAWIQGAYSPLVYVQQTSDPSIVQEVELNPSGQGFIGSFVMPDYDVTIIGKYGGSGNTDTLSVTGKTAKVKYKTLKKKTVSLPINKLLTVKNNETGNLKYTLKSAKKGKKSYKKYFKISNGKLKIKKGLKKGTYKVKLKVSDKTATIKIIVK